MQTLTNDTSATSKPGSPGWWVRDKDGNLAVAMFPNPAIWVWLATIVLAWTGWLASVSDATLTAVGRGALIVWALDELTRGQSPFRRVLGAIVLGYEIVSLVA